MIDIISDKERLLKSLRELEFEFAQGNISEETYNSKKRALTAQLETLDVADRVKRLQGKEDTERPLEFWEEQKKEKEVLEEKEQLMKKFVTDPNGVYSVKPPQMKKEEGINKSRVVAFAILALIFFAGIGFGVFLMKVPSESSAVPMVVNDSAFPVVNNTTSVAENVTVLNTSSIVNTNTTDTNSSNRR